MSQIFSPGFGAKFSKITAEYPAGTDGGGSSAGWQTRALNTIGQNDLDLVLAANTFILPAGKYFVWASAVLHNSGKGRIRFNNGGANILGLVLRAGTSSAVAVELTAFGAFEIVGASKTCSLSQFCSSGKAANGLGIAAGDGSTETYASVIIQKVN